MPFVWYKFNLAQMGNIYALVLYNNIAVGRCYVRDDCIACLRLMFCYLNVSEYISQYNYYVDIISYHDRITCFGVKFLRENILCRQLWLQLMIFFLKIKEIYRKIIYIKKKSNVTRIAFSLGYALCLFSLMCVCVCVWCVYVCGVLQNFLNIRQHCKYLIMVIKTNKRRKNLKLNPV